MDLIQLVARLTLDSSDYESKLRKASSPEATNKMSQNFGKLALAGAAAVGGFVASSVKVGTDFQQSMSQVYATMLKSKEEVLSQMIETDTAYGKFSGNLEEYARFMAANTKYNAQETAEALNYMALAGYDVEQSVEALPNVLALASAGAFDLATASDMVTDAQSALGLEFDEVGTLIDQMAKTASKSNTSVEQLGEAILVVGGNAQALSGGTTELNTALGMLANVGIKGSEGGTALRNVLLSLQAPTDKAQEALNELGVSAFDADGNFKPLEQTMGELEAQLSTMTAQERAGFMSAIFNKRDIRSVTALMGGVTYSVEEMDSAMASAGLSTLDFSAIMQRTGQSAEEVTQALYDDIFYNMKVLQSSNEEIADYLHFEYDLSYEDAYAAIEAMDGVVKTSTSSWEDLEMAIEDSAGAAQEMMNIQEDNLAGDVKKLQSAFQEFQLVVSEKVTPVLRKFVQWITVAIQNFEKYQPIIIGVATALGTLAIALNMKAMITSLITTFKTLFTLLSANPFGIIIALVAGLIAYFVNLYKTNEEFRKNVDTAWTNIKTTISNVVSAIVQKWNDLKTAIGNVVTSMQEKIDAAKQAWEDFKAKIKGIIDTVKGFFNFEWNLPKLKLPHLSITGSFSLVPPNVPKFSIDWYKRAYDSPLLFTQPTVIPTANGLKGFGDGNGGELVIGMHKLKELTQGNGGYVQNITINAPKQLDASEVARQTRNASRDMVLKMKVG